MNRRDLLKKSLLSLGALALVNLASAVNALASVAVTLALFLREPDYLRHTGRWLRTGRGPAE